MFRFLPRLVSRSNFNPLIRYGYRFCSSNNTNDLKDKLMGLNLNKDIWSEFEREKIYLEKLAKSGDTNGINAFAKDRLELDTYDTSKFREWLFEQSQQAISVNDTYDMIMNEIEGTLWEETKVSEEELKCVLDKLYRKGTSDYFPRSRFSDKAFRVDMRLCDWDNNVFPKYDIIEAYCRSDVPSIISVVGVSGCGKSSTLLRTNNHNFNNGLVFTGTKFDRNDYSYIPEEYIIQGYDENILRNYLNGIENYIEKYGSAPLSFLVFDDLLYLISSMDKYFMNFLGNMRHYNIVVLFAVQFLRTGIPVLRELTDYALIFKSNRNDTLKAIYNEFGTLFKTLKEFKEHFFETTREPFTAMLCDRNLELEDNYLKFTAPDLSLLEIRLKY